MMYGVLVHASTIGEHWLFEAIKGISSYVRMEAFFVLAGFFSALQLQKIPAVQYWKVRAVVLAVPLAVTLFSTALATNYLIQCYLGTCFSFSHYWAMVLNKSTEVFFIWHLHLWFLFSLIAYSLIAPQLNRTVKSLRHYIASASERGGSILILLTMATAIVLLRGGYDVALEPFIEHTAFEFVVRSTCSYFPYFAIGVCVYHTPALLHWFERPHPVATVVVFAILGLYELLWSEMLDGVVRGVAKHAVHGMAAVIATNLLWILFRHSANQKRASIDWITRASYTVYLFHYACIAILANIIVLPDAWLLARFAVIVAITYAVTLFFHAGVVERIPLIRLLLNGRPSGKLRAPQPQPA